MENEFEIRNRARERRKRLRQGGRRGMVNGKDVCKRNFAGGWADY